MDMPNQSSQEPNLNALAIVPAKRKRGRPRKYPSADDPNFHLGGSKFGPPPGFRRQQTYQAGPVRTSKDSMAGQLVSGVIESEFDGGYLLTVKVGNSDITLRGVVFKPGRCDPVTAENDVAPNIQMVHRNEVPLPSGSYKRVPKYRSRGRNRVSNPLALSTSLVAFKSKLAPPPPPAAAANDRAIVPLRGNVVPVVLQPVAASSNGATFLNQCGSFGTQEAQPVALQVVHPSDEMPRQVTRNPSEVAAPQQQQPLVLQEKASSPEVDVKPMKPPGMPFGNLLKEVISNNRLHVQNEGSEHSKEAAAKSGITMEADGASNANLHHLHSHQQQQHMFIEPFHSLQHYTMKHSTAVQSPMDDDRSSGKMTKLLQAMQENAMKNRMH